MVSRVKFSFFLILLTSFIACTTEPDLQNVPTITYSNDVQTIISAHCNFNGCHGANPVDKGALLTYEDVSKFVKYGDAHGSKLYQVITRRGSVEERMPPNGYLDVSSENAKLIYWWIEQGARNN